MIILMSGREWKPGFSQVFLLFPLFLPRKRNQFSLMWREKPSEWYMLTWPVSDSQAASGSVRKLVPRFSGVYLGYSSPWSSCHRRSERSTHGDCCAAPFLLLLLRASTVVSGAPQSAVRAPACSLGSTLQNQISLACCWE